MASGEIYIGGEVEGRLKARAGKLEIDGQIAGPSEISVAELYLGEGARFGEDVRYWTEEGEVDFTPYLASGVSANFDSELKMVSSRFKKKFLGFGFFAFNAWRLLAAGAITILLIVFLPGLFSRFSGQLKQRFPSYLGHGMLFIFGMPLLMGLSFASVIGIPLGLIIAFVYGATLIAGNALVAAVGAFELREYLGADWTKGGLILAGFGILLGIRAVNLIPLIGGIVSFLLLGAGIGYLVYALRKRSDAGHAEEAGADIV
ncbi:MAG: hypothetical protein R3350_09895, partial [Saprospiraceae bacterium]|nr:hypothetical protein [Saprospiraceae bacterium]